MPWHERIYRGRRYRYDVEAGAMLGVWVAYHDGPLILWRSLTRGTQAYLTASIAMISKNAQWLTPIEGRPAPPTEGG